MPELELYQYLLIALTFVWSGLVRSGLGFGGSVLSLPFMLLIDDRPLVYLPIISVHLLFFAGLSLVQKQFQLRRLRRAGGNPSSHVDWRYLRGVLGIMIVPKLIGVMGLITLPAPVMSAIIFTIVALYSLSYIFNKPFSTNSRAVDALFLIVGAYFSGTSLIGGPLLIAVFASHVAKEQLRDTLFALWIILVSIKMLAFIVAGIDLQWSYHLWLLPCAGIGHMLGLRLHDKLLLAESAVFYRLLGTVLLLVSILGLLQSFVL